MHPLPDTHLQATRWLGARLRVSAVNRRTFPMGPAVQDEIVTTNRLILILQGELDYTAEGRTFRLHSGTQLLVPAWMRRVWSVPRRGPCEIVWCEFDDPGMESGWDRCRFKKWDSPGFQTAKRAHLGLLQRFQRKAPPDDAWKALHLEAALKSLLVQFLEHCEIPPTGTGRSKAGRAQETKVHPQLKLMLQWVGGHFQEPAVLEELYRRSGMSRNYFRQLFSTALSCPPHAYIERLRMRHARFLLHGGSLSVKQIAAVCGYADALYFSRIYHRFWGHPPTGERENA